MDRAEHSEAEMFARLRRIAACRRDDALIGPLGREAVAWALGELERLKIQLEAKPGVADSATPPNPGG